VLIFSAVVAWAARAQLSLTFENQGAGPAGSFLWPIYLLEKSDPYLAKQGNTDSGRPPGKETYTGGLVSGTGFTAELRVGPAKSGESGLVPVAATTFRTGTSAGLLVPATVAVPGLPPGSSFAWQARVWENRGGTLKSWQQAIADPEVARGVSLVVVAPPDSKTTHGGESFNLHQDGAPQIVAPPEDQQTVLGASVSFTVKAAGPEPLTYGWLKDGRSLADDGRISGSATATLKFTNVRQTDAGEYRVVVSNRYGARTSAAASLSVELPPLKDLFLNEWLALNVTGRLDEDKDRPGWIELFNGGTTALDLSGCYLTDTKAAPTKWRVPAGTAIAGGGYHCVFASGKDRQQHTNFKLSGSGGSLLLYAPDGATVIDQVGYGAQQADVSEGRWPDGSTRILPLTPTPCSPNVRLPSTQRFTFSFAIDGPHSVFFRLFNVNTTAAIQIEATWQGTSPNLTLALTGRRRAELPDPTTAYASATGPSPLSLSYEVTEADLARGVAWRLVISDPAGLGQAQGTVTLTVPFDAALSLAFQREKVSLRSGDLWPGAGLQAGFLANLAATPAAGLHALISLTRAVTCDEAEQLERLGLVRQHHLARPGYHSVGLVRKGINLADPLLAALLRRITPLDPEDKINPPILVGDYSRFRGLTEDGTVANAVLNPDGTLELSVLFAPDTTQAALQAILRAEAVSFSPITDYAWRATIGPARLRPLASYDAVSWIDAGPALSMPDNNNSRAALNVNGLQNVAAVNAGPPPNITYGGLTGAGITAGVQDTGLDATHADLNIVATIAPNAVAAHGTHVAGTLAGSGVQSSLNDAGGNPNNGAPFQWRGMAPQAALVSSSDLVNGANLLTAIQSNSLDLVNRSQSVTYDGNYDLANQTIDANIRGGSSSGGTAIPRRPHAYSAGNHGIVPGNQEPPKPASPAAGGPAVGTTQLFNNGQVGYFSITKQTKNTIVVGNWDSNVDGLGNDNGLNASSSLGPTYDGRLKPDVVAPGTRVVSTGTGTTANGYRFSSGTSMATPAVSGIIALLLQGWQNTYSTPLGTTIDASPPLPSTFRALLIQTATDIVANNVRGQASVDIDSDSNPANNGGQPDGNGLATATAGPDFTTGWGFVNAQAALTLAQDLRTENGRPVPNRIIQDAVQQGAVREYDFVVSQVGPLRVTLAWDDVEGAVQNPVAAPLLVNDLDLELVDPNGAVLYPWQLGQTILDLAGNPLANNAQPPGTDIQVQLPILAINNPTYTWVVSNCIAGAGCVTQWSPTGPGTGPGNVDYIPANALTGNGAWVATQGKDHLNNVEQVFVANVQLDQVGHWKARVLGFDVRQGPQDFSLVGFPYPDLPELIASCSDKVGLPAFNTPLAFTWTVANVGAVATPGGFAYQVWLSRDFFVDAGDVALVDANQAALGPLAAGASVDQNSSVQISQAQADALLGNPPGTTTLQDLIDADVFLLVQADSGDVVLEHEETNVASVQLARLVDAVLVMDRSGSMGEEVPVSSGNRRKIDILKDSANLFLDLMRLDTGDELGAVSFSADVTTDFGPDGNLTALTAGNLEQAKEAVDDLEPDTKTNIRDGLQRGLDLLTAAANPSHRRVLIFFSDGMKTAGGDPTAAAFLNQFGANDVTVYSVGFGTVGASGDAGIDVPLLQTLANANPAETGFFHVTESAASLDKFFVNAVAGAIQSEVVVDPEADLLPGQSATVDAVLNRQDAYATFILTWDNPALTLNLAVRSPAGLELDAANAGAFADRVTLLERPAYRLMSVRFPLTTGPSRDHAGRWTMILRNPGAATVHYAASVIAESTLRANFQQPQRPGGGPFQLNDPVPLEVTVQARGGTPVSGARVVVTPTVPLVSLGNLLAAAGITPAELARVPLVQDGDVLSERERLYLALQNRVGGGNLVRSGEGAPFELAAGETAGHYVGQFPRAPIDGTYSFLARTEGLTPDCEPFQREGVRSIGIASAPDPGRTPIDVGWLDPGNPGGGVVVTVTPVGSGGLYVGPGFSGSVTITAGGQAEPTSGVLDNLDGSYRQTFRLTQPGLAAFVVTVGGISLPTVVADAALPTPVAVLPPGAPNDRATPIEVWFAPNTDLSAVTGITLLAGGEVLPLAGFQVNAAGPSLRATVPAGVPPALYSVLLEGKSGRGPAAGGLTFRVTGRGQDFPDPVGQVADRLDSLRTTGTPADGLAQLGLLVGDLRNLPTGANLSQAAILAAYDQVAKLLGRGQGQVSEAEVDAVHAVVNAAKIDARSLDRGPVVTPTGKGVRLDLGNGVATTFSSVLASGQTTARLLPGPVEIPPANRGEPHVTYQVTTTAQLDPASSLDVQFEFEEGDFPNESQLRVLHLEQGRWIDRTASLDTTKNLIVARVGHLSKFVIVSGEVPPAVVLRAVGFETTDAFVFRLEGPPGTYEIQQSTDLRQWAKTDAVVLTGGAADLRDPAAGRAGSRFYRAVRTQ